MFAFGELESMVVSVVVVLVCVYNIVLGERVKSDPAKGGCTTFTTFDHVVNVIMYVIAIVGGLLLLWQLACTFTDIDCPDKALAGVFGGGAGASAMQMPMGGGMDHFGSYY